MVLANRVVLVLAVPFVVDVVDCVVGEVVVSLSVKERWVGDSCLMVVLTVVLFDVGASVLTIFLEDLRVGCVDIGLIVFFGGGVTDEVGTDLCLLLFFF